MNILNISSIIPLKGLKRENDIILRIQDYLKDNFGYNFTIAKSLPYVPFILSLISDKWRKYRDYQQKGQLKVQGYDTVIYPWLLPPTSNFWINYFLIPLNWIWYKLIVGKRISLEARNTNLMLAQNLIPDSILAYWLHKRYGKPYILTMRGVENYRWLKLPILRSVIYNSEKLLTPSPTIYQDLNQDYEIELIPHPIHEMFFSEKQKKWSKPSLISVCRLLDWKRIDLVIETLAQLKEEGFEFEYRIIGDGPEVTRLKKLANRLNLNNLIHFEGFLDHEKIPIYLNRANIYIQPSYPETLGRSFLEAAAAGCLIVGHENTGVDGILSHQESAIFVNQETIYKELKKVFENLKSMNNYSDESQKVVESLKWNKIGKRYQRHFKNALTKFDKS